MNICLVGGIINLFVVATTKRTGMRVQHLIGEDFIQIAGLMVLFVGILILIFFLQQLTITHHI